MHGTCWHRLLVQVVYRLLVQVDYKLLVQVVTGGLVLIGTVYNSISHSDSVTVVPSFYLYFRAVVDGERIGGCSHLPVVAGEHRGL
jgi:hypothetical protein